MIVVMCGRVYCIRPVRRALDRWWYEVLKSGTTGFQKERGDQSVIQNECGSSPGLSFCL